MRAGVGLATASLAVA